MVLLLIRFALAAILVVAAIAKLLDRQGTKRSLLDFGVPARVAAAGAIALPVTELAVAALLVPASTARWGALAAGLLLVVFSAAIIRANRRGEEPDCNCFGTVHSAPAGPAALVRNLVLAGAATAVVVSGPGESIGAIEWAPVAAAGGAIVLAGLLIGHAWFSWQLFRQNGRLLVRIGSLEEALGLSEASPSGPGPGLAEGDAAPPFELPNLSGSSVSLEALLARSRPLALVFTDPACGACDELLPGLARLQERRGDEVTVALVSRGGASENRAKLNGHAIDDVLLQRGNEVGSAYGANGYPAAVMVDAIGRIASPVALGAGSIEEMLALDEPGSGELEMLEVHQR